MNLTDYRNILRVELSDTTVFFSDTELDRAVFKSVGLMSRLLPKRDVVESVVVRHIVDETLVITTGTGTLTKKPLDVGSLIVPNKVVNVDYRVNHLTGVVTGLPDGSYTVSYTLDPMILDISGFLSDYIRVERLEYPAGDTPVSLPTFDVLGDFITLRGSKLAFTEDKYLRLTHLSKWSLPTVSLSGDYPSHLADIIVIGSVGQSLIFKAVKYVQEAAGLLGVSNTTAGAAVIALDKVGGHLTGATESTGALLAQIATDAVSLRTGIVVALAAANTALDGVSFTTAIGHLTDADRALDKVAVYLETNETALGLDNANARAVLERITADVANLRTAINTALGATKTDLDTVKTADIVNADGVWTNESKHILSTLGIPNAEDYLETGVGNINAVTAGDNVGELYRRYADSALDMASAWAQRRSDFLSSATVRTSSAMGYVQEAVQRLSHLRSYLDEAGSWGTQARGFVEEAVRRIGMADSALAQQRTRIEQANGYLGEATGRLSNLRVYIEQAVAYTQISNGFISEARERVNVSDNYRDLASRHLDVAGRFLASGQAKIQEFLIALGVRAEFTTQRASSEQRA